MRHRRDPSVGDASLPFVMLIGRVRGRRRGSAAVADEDVLGRGDVAPEAGEPVAERENCAREERIFEFERPNCASVLCVHTMRHLARDRLKIDVPVIGLRKFLDILARGDV